jgi:diguanylate cyclase (GGDEF)-like protein
MRGRVATLVVLAATLMGVAAAAVVIVQLQAHAQGDRDAEATLGALRLQLFQARDIPWSASPEEDIPTEEVRGELADTREGIERSLEQLADGGHLPGHREINRSVSRVMRALGDVLELVAADRADDTGDADAVAARGSYRADGMLIAAGKRLREQSEKDLTRAKQGAIGAMLLLFLAFAWFYLHVARARRRAELLSAENQRLLAESREEALTDALTGLRNRRALMLDLEQADPDPGEQCVLVLLDLDGFKAYNDSFGHPAGDLLLTRLADRLSDTMQGVGTAYRMGGDEFCVVASVAQGGAPAIAALAASALSQTGTAFTVGSSYGVAQMPADTTDPSEALRLADQRMYQDKGSGRVSPSRQSADVLLKLQMERDDDLGRHTQDVSELAAATGRRLGLGEQEIDRLSLAAELHDVGKAAIPDAILEKPGKLDDSEWEFMRRHTLIGESVLRAAPSLADIADLVRSSHESMDGSGYPDGLRGEEIPIGSRIIAVCDAFDAMLSDRPYRNSLSQEQAVAELRRCAGNQFDPSVVEAFAAAVREDLRPDARRQGGTASTR